MDETSAAAPSGELARPRRRGVWIVLAVLTAVAVVVPSGLRLSVQAIRRTSTAVTPYQHAIKEVRLDMAQANVSVAPGPAGEARVYKRLSWAVTEPRVDEQLVGDVLYVTFRCADPEDSLSGLGCDGDIDVQVPPGARVSAVSRVGRIDVRGLTGDLDLRTGSGRIGLADVRGRVRVRARSGEIAATGLASPEILAQVSSGRLDLRCAEPPGSVEATAGSGAVRLIVPPGSRYRVVGWTGSGTAHLNRALADDRSERRLSVYSDSGSTYVDYRDD
ncbi:DUF4097 family beta strand repeat-containing protein [Actinomadura fibrosa]|nr:DUF4097 family beta strand repeat-containing protein [Actinomadura fibrosa]